MGSFACMRHPVSLHVAFSNEASAAVGALVWPFARVDSHVQSQGSALSEVHAAFLTPVRFLSCVDSHVILQMVRLFKAFCADGTGVSSLTHVFVRSKTFSPFTARVRVLPFLWPPSRWCECLNPFSIHRSVCVHTVFTLIYGVEGLRNSGQSGQLAAFPSSVSCLSLCCANCCVGQNLVVAPL